MCMQRDGYRRYSNGSGRGSWTGNDWLYLALFDAQIADNVSYCLYIALLNVPGENVHYLDLKRVEKLVTKPQCDLHSARCTISMARGKLRNRINCASDLLTQLEKGKRNKQVRNLCWRLYSSNYLPCLHGLKNDMLDWEAELKRLEEEDKETAMKSWKNRIVSDLSYRSSWITEKRVSYYPQVEFSERTSRTKLEAVDLIKQVDDSLKRTIMMTKSERLIRATAIEKSPTTSLQQCQWKRTWFEGTPSGFTSVQRWSWLRSVDGAWTQVHCKDTRSS